MPFFCGCGLVDWLLVIGWRINFRFNQLPITNQPIPKVKKPSSYDKGLFWWCEFVREIKKRQQKK
jgi:hypothetical protein